MELNWTVLNDWNILTELNYGAELNCEIWILNESVRLAVRRLKALPPDASHASVIDRSPKVRTPDQGVRDLEVPTFQMPADR